jgi:hypothetical protein
MEVLTQRFWEEMSFGNHPGEDKKYCQSKHCGWIHLHTENIEAPAIN